MKKPTDQKEIVPAQGVAQKIFLIRGHRVMIDRDLAEMYEVSTKALNQAVKRNNSRFPDDFMFQLTQDETRQLVTNCDRFTDLNHASRMPYAFTGPGVLMLSSVLKSKLAIDVNLFIIRATKGKANNTDSRPENRKTQRHLRLVKS